MNTLIKYQKSQQTVFQHMIQRLSVTAVASCVLVATVSVQAESKLGYRMSPPKPVIQNNSGSTFSNSTYKDVTVPPHMTRPPVYQQNYPYSPRHPNQPHPSYPQGNNGVTIIYNQSFPSQTTYSNQSYGYVNGNGTIQSSTYMLISDWRRYGLPDPAVGMHWIYQNGRYLQVPNDQ